MINFIEMMTVADDDDVNTSPASFAQLIGNNGANNSAD